MCASLNPRAAFNRPSRPLIGILTVLALGLAATGAQAGRKPSAAPGKGTAVTIDYRIALAGMPIGTARLASSIAGSRYQMDVSATLTGLVGAITGGRGSARVTGNLANQPVPSAFSVLSKTASASVAVRMAFSHGTVAQAEVLPPLIDASDRVKVTAAHKRNTMDPASALLMPAHASGQLTDPANCNRSLPVFDGATRFTVVLSYGETRQVQKPGYTGPVLVCNARYQAIAGHRPDRPGVRFMEENRDMSVWLAPVEGERVLLPMRISVKTQLGTNIIEATRWSQSGGRTAAAAEAEPVSTLAQATVAAH